MIHSWESGAVSWTANCWVSSSQLVQQQLFLAWLMTDRVAPLGNLMKKRLKERELPGPAGTSCEQSDFQVTNDQREKKTKCTTSSLSVRSCSSSHLMITHYQQWQCYNSPILCSNTSFSNPFLFLTIILLHGRIGYTYYFSCQQCLTCVVCSLTLLIFLWS